MTDQTQYIEEIFKNLPNNVREAISSPEGTSKLEKIAEKYDLSTQKTQGLVDETGLVMLGITHPSDYIKNLEEKLDISSEKSRDIAKNVNEEIFAPIKESLKKIHEIADNTQTKMEATKSQKPDPYREPTDSAEPQAVSEETNIPLSKLPIQTGVGEQVKDEDKSVFSKKGEYTFQPYVNGKKQEVEEGRVEDKTPTPSASKAGQSKEIGITTSDISHQSVVNNERKAERHIPDDVKAAIASVKVQEQLRAIGEKQKLHIDKIQNLINETHSVMSGSKHPKDYIRNLQKSLGIDLQKAKIIATEINNQIFKPVRESLKKIHKIDTAVVEKKDSVPPAVLKKPDTENTKAETESSKTAQSVEINHSTASEERIDVEDFNKGNSLKQAEKPEQKTESLAVPKKITVPEHEPQNLIEQKLKTPFVLPMEESKLTEIDDKKKKNATSQSPSKYEVDPYREPVE